MGDIFLQLAGSAAAGSLVCYAGMSPVRHRFARYVLVSVPGIMIELLLLSILLRFTSLLEPVAVALAFLTVYSCTYFIMRRVTYYGSTQTLLPGYLTYLFIAGIAVSAVTIGSLSIHELTGWSLLLSRFVFGGVSGILNFTTNAVFNFKVL